MRKPTVGHVSGDLTLTIGDNAVDFGTISIPLVAACRAIAAIFDEEAES